MDRSEKNKIEQQNKGLPPVLITDERPFQCRCPKLTIYHSLYMDGQV
jgi:hypothetical protein